MYHPFFKNIIDYLGAFFMLVLFSPIIILVSTLLMVQNMGTPFFLQQRNGKDEEVFRVIKFKTMNDAKDDSGNLLPNSERLTTLGKIVRKTSVDELPQLFNILKGEMSFIGPRPLPIRYLPYFKEHERLRFSIKPGISGLAQVSGRNLVDWDRRLGLDVVYVKNLSLKTDIIILLKTITNVLSRKNVVVDPTSKMVDLDVLRQSNKKEKAENE